MKKLQFRNSIYLFITAFIWGSSFVAQSVGMDYIGPFTFNAIRFTIGGIFLLPGIWLLGKRKKTKEDKGGESENKKELLKGGISCGVILFVASSLQQIGITHTSVGKTGFLTALYIVLVPVIGIFMGRKSGRKLWGAVGLALFGLYLLCMKTGSFRLEVWDLLVIGGAVVFSVHILVIDHFTELADGVKMSCIQFFVSGFLGFICMLVFEVFSFQAVFMAWQPILYTGILSCGIAYTLQIVGQKGMNPIVVSLILSLEAVIGAVSGWVFLGQKLSRRETAGCIVMFTALVLAQLPVRDRGGKQQNVKEEKRNTKQKLGQEAC